LRSKTVRNRSALRALRNVRSRVSVGPEQSQEKEISAQQSLVLPEALVKTIHHFAPRFLPALASVTDPRDPRLIIYPIEQLLLVGILMFVTKIGARRNVKYMLGTPAFIENLEQICRIFYPDNYFYPGVMPHGCTLNYLLKKIENLEVCQLRTLLIRAILRGRCLERFRLVGRYYLVAIDGTGHLTFNTKHCKHCLKKTKDEKVLYYYHPILEAKLILGNGMALSIATEFIENENENVSKQDCEQKAFHRLAKQIKKDFPQLRICLLLDSLYPGEPIFKVCEDNRWAYLITFKEGTMPAVFKEYETLTSLAPKDRLVVNTRNRQQTFRWANDVVTDARKVNALECLEKTPKGPTRFVFLSSIRIDATNIKELSNGGRLRWKIENEGFNTQKNGGYGLEHAFSLNNVAMKNFYVLMQIAHTLNQLMEKGNLLRERIWVDMGSLKVFSRMMWAALTQTVIDPNRLHALLGQRIQIRFEPSYFDTS